MTNSPRRFPDFLGIGAQKAGTSWLHANLCCHPALWLPPVKELHYFNDIHLTHQRHWIGPHRRTQGSEVVSRQFERTPEQRDHRLIGRMADYIAGPISDEWYGSMFSLAQAAQTCGEITPEYCLLPDAGIEHVLRLSPSVKILFAMRDPIDRSWSHIRMQVRRAMRRGNPIDVRQALTLTELEQRVNYPELLARWSSQVPEQRLFLMFFDDIQARPLALMEQICRFLQVDFDPGIFPRLRQRMHVGEAMTMPGDLYETLKERLRPVYDQLLVLYPEIAREWCARHY